MTFGKGYTTEKRKSLLGSVGKKKEGGRHEKNPVDLLSDYRGRTSLKSRKDPHSLFPKFRKSKKTPLVKSNYSFVVKKPVIC